MPQDTIIPNFHNAAAAPDAQKHSCKTNPILRNKPNFRRSAKTQGANCAKRTQFSHRCRGGRGRRGTGQGANVQNEPNLAPVSGNGCAGRREAPCRGRLRKTKPISRRCPAGGGRRGTGHGTNVQNEPNLPSPRAPNKANFRTDRKRQKPAGPPVPPVGQFCETKPISARQAGPMDVESASVYRPHPGGLLIEQSDS
jgi:hypothetical protein